MSSKRPGLVDGLREGAKAVALRELGEGIGEGLNRLKWWELRPAQRCPIKDCPGRGGPYTSVAALRNHLYHRHADMSQLQQSEAIDTARFLCRRAPRTTPVGESP
jgi:hypothetical protein